VILSFLYRSRPRGMSDPLARDEPAMHRGRPPNAREAACHHRPTSRRDPHGNLLNEERALIRERAASASVQGTPAAVDSVSTPQRRVRGPGASLRGIGSGAHILALTDQGLVSATSFLTTVIVGRSTQPSELGLYAIGLALLASCLCIQEALISTPYAVQRHHCSGTPAERAGTALAQTGVLAALAAVVLAVAACGLGAWSAGPDLVGLSWALAAVAPFLILREFARRFAFAHLRLGQALILDTAGAVIQLATLVWLGWIGQMSAVTACAALGGAGALTGLVWLYVARAGITVRADKIPAATKHSWGLGKWLLASQLVLTVQASLVYWLLAWLGGMTATGIYTACMSIALFSNPLILGASNLLTPSSALAWTEGGGERLRRESILASLGLGAVLTLFCVAVALFGDVAMHFLYPSKDYAGQGQTVTVLALGMLVMSVGIPAISALTSMERPRVIFWTGLWSAAVSVVLIWWLMPKWGLVGAAYGVLAGNLVRTATRWIALLSLGARTGRKAGPGRIGADLIPAEVFLVLQQMSHGRNCRDWVIEQLDQGLQADIYAVRCPDLGRPTLETYRSVAIKLYKPGALPDVELVRRQFESLSRLHAALNGSNVRGWKISIPAPLYICASPVALVMSTIPGKTLSSWLEHGDLSREVLDSLPHAVIAAVNRLWSIGQVHGDLTFDNILCDVGARDLSFVDPGMRTVCPFQDDLTSRWRPPAHDLAHTLYDVGVSVLTTLVDPMAFRRKRSFAENLVRAFIATIGASDERRSQLEEIRACAGLHLMTLGGGPYPLRKVYQRLQRQVGLRRVQKIIGRVRAEAGLSSIRSPEFELLRPSCPIRDLD
jgi:O-antigen/teichoic acid export membrane protein/tRNA A-37 threonylcarbamoyl transferase component Bud32